MIRTGYDPEVDAIHVGFGPESVKSVSGRSSDFARATVAEMGKSCKI
jgi:hypothetical protein